MGTNTGKMEEKIVGICWILEDMLELASLLSDPEFSHCTHICGWMYQFLCFQ